MSVTIQVRRDSAANWTSAGPVLHQGEIGLETDTGKFKIGDGVTAWASLPYFASGGTGQAILSTVNPASGAVTLNMTAADAFAVTLTGNVTFTFAGSQAGYSSSFVLYLYQDSTGGRSVTWPGSVSWIGGSQPSIPTTANSLTILVFETINNGTTWYGSAVQELPALPLAVANGGTGQTTAAAGYNALSPMTTTGDIEYESGTGVASRLPIGSTGQVLTVTSGLPAWQAAGGGSNGGIFGDGSDGAVTLDGTVTVSWATKVGSVYTMNTDAFLSSLTINSGVTLIPGNARIWCTGTITNNGTISLTGGNASGATGGASSTFGSWIYESSQGGAAGGTGAGSSVSQISGIGTGGSGNGGAGGTGAAGNGSNPQFGSNGKLFRQPHFPVTGLWAYNGNNTPFTGAQGGGGGGGDGTNAGGGGGGGGGIVLIWSKAIVNNGTITVAGGNGASPAAGNAGGGGGGGGGVLVLYTASAVTGSGSTSVAGGTAGTAHGTGSNGSAGASGTYINVIVQ